MGVVAQLGLGSAYFISVEVVFSHIGAALLTSCSSWLAEQGKGMDGRGGLAGGAVEDEVDGSLSCVLFSERPVVAHR